MKPIVGHEARWNALSRAFAKNQIPQTLLISGPPGVGKSLFALRYSQLLLCPNLETQGDLPAPCGVCKTCHQVEIEVFPDYRVFRPIISKAEPTRAPDALDSSLIPVELARDFNEEAIRKPIAGPRKVLWMHGFEKAQEAAQNAMLKTLEEPPGGSFLILTTENARNLRETILSRCWHLPLPPVADGEIEPWLRDSFPSASPQQVREALRAAAGRPGAAFRELERSQKPAPAGTATESGAARSRFAIAGEMLARLDGASPVAALSLTEEALQWANIWWAEDAGEGADLKKLGAKGPRTAAARFLDELMIAGRARWMQNLTNAPRAAASDGAGRGLNRDEIGAARLDQIRKTRHYILRNANRQLALDVMFGRLISLRPRNSARPR